MRYRFSEQCCTGIGRGGLSKQQELTLGEPLPDPSATGVVPSRKATNVSTNVTFSKWPVSAMADSSKVAFRRRASCNTFHVEQLWGRSPQEQTKSQTSASYVPAP